MRIERFLTSQTMRFTLSREEGDSQREINVYQLTLQPSKTPRKAELTRQEKCLALVPHHHCGIRFQLVEENTVSYKYSETQTIFLYAARTRGVKQL